MARRVANICQVSNNVIRIRGIALGQTPTESSTAAPPMWSGAKTNCRSLQMNRMIPFSVKSVE